MFLPVTDPFRIDAVPRTLRRPVEAALGVRSLRQLYRSVQLDQPDPSNLFEHRILEALAVRPSVTEADLASIPARGPLIIVANHPHGALDGLLLLDVVRRVRPDVRILANRLLERIPELHDSCFFVDPFEGPEAAARSRAGLRSAHLWLRGGGALVVFPAGEVGHSWVDGTLVDRAWKETDEIANEIDRLGDDACLIESGSFRVFCVTADAIPSTLQEIGRLREVTFRAAGEGTGRTIDLDRFDQAYLHLFAWDADKQQIVGAYRMGRSDRISSEAGVRGLYTRMLFDYDDRLLTRIGAPALELGRSFVRAEYQKNYNALLLLWRGIGAFVARHPQYRYLFGPVSISARYSDTSHAMLVEFLRQNHTDRDLADLVSAITPPSPAPPIGRTLPGSIDDLNRLIAESEDDGKGIPVLLRQYLTLNARLLGVNIDRDFGDAVDALMIVDLTTVSPTILQRYLGKQGSADFLTFHERSRSACAA